MIEEWGAYLFAIAFVIWCLAPMVPKDLFETSEHSALRTELEWCQITRHYFPTVPESDRCWFVRRELEREGR